MSLPVSQYEALLAEFRGLRHKALRVQELARLDSASVAYPSTSTVSTSQNAEISGALDYTMESLLLDRHNPTRNLQNVNERVEGDAAGSEDECGEARCSGAHMSVSSEPVPERIRGMSSLYHGTWPTEKTMWNSEPTGLGREQQDLQNSSQNSQDGASIKSFASSSCGAPFDRVLGSPARSMMSSQQLEAKVDMVYSLLSILGGQEHADMGETLLALSANPESCLAMRQAGCIPLLVQLVQSDKDKEARKKASQALYNLVHSQPDQKLRKREIRILKLLETCKTYTEALLTNNEAVLAEFASEEAGNHPVTIAYLMKFSFDEGRRQAICQFGGIQTLAMLMEAEYSVHGVTTTDEHCNLLRRYACMALTNLTFGDSGNKAVLCSFRDFMRGLVVQLQSTNEELRQVTGSVLRNLSWRVEPNGKDILREVGSVTGLMKAAMMDNKENTLKTMLSALWNLSAHCSENKSEICAVEGALGFLVDMLTYKTPSKSLTVTENAGGILRNISSQIAVREDYREILRSHNCLQILLNQLKSPSLIIVSNACGTLWNLSAKCATDQETLWQMGAPAMLRSLNHSKHKTISMGSSAALKNLLSARPQQNVLPTMDSTALALDLPILPTLGARKQKALLQDLDNTLSETHENIDKDSPDKSETFLTKTKYLDDDVTKAMARLNLSEIFTRTPSPSQIYRQRNPPCTYIPVRNKFSDCSYEDEIVASDQPIDYSRKYSETKMPNNDASTSKPSSSKDFSFGQSEDENKSFGIYAETDLDQPTDYSLRYAEDDSDSENCPKIQEFLQDTVKTYCTGDTPYETPFNFSTATSMSDLRIDQEKPLIDVNQIKTNIKNKEATETFDEKDRCSNEDISQIDNRPKPVAGNQNKSVCSSGVMSPEKPVNYCEEGTPGYFSRVSSFGSLNSGDQCKLEPTDKETTTIPQESERKPDDKTSPKTVTEIKAVKFEQQVNYAEETPLMFSRSSSLASLDSIEQHSIHDDRSSVISDFSRLTSGIVSPSELPDSPTQTVPPSPKPRKMPLEFPCSSKSRSTEARPQPAPRNLSKASIFEDNVTKFKEESTPVQFSTATSLSSLTIDDQEDNLQETTSSRQENKENFKPKKEVQTEKGDVEKEQVNALNITDELGQESEDEDDDILAACINIGMQNNRHNQNKPVTSMTSRLPLPNFKYHSKTQSSIPLPCSASNRSTNRLNTTDTVKTYCTEDTPAGLSHAGSNSDLSVLSIPNDNKSRKDYLSDDSSNLSGENDNILAECIQSGMPKAKKDVNKPGTSNSKAMPCLGRRNIQTSTPVKNSQAAVGNTRRAGSPEANKVQLPDNRKGESSLPMYLIVKDEVESYAVENSPCQFSLRSSLSDLTVDGSVAGLKTSQANNSSPGTTQENHSVVHTSPNQANASDTRREGEQRELSRQNSLSSLSVESLGSLETEQALLEQCISSGMPKSSSCVTPDNRVNIGNISKPVGIATKQFSKPSGEQQCAIDEDNIPKNGNVASVAGNIILQVNVVCPDMSTVAAGVGKNLYIGQENGSDLKLTNQAERIGTQIDTMQDLGFSPEEISSIEPTRNGSNKSSRNLSSLEYSYTNSDTSVNFEIKDDIDSCLSRTCEESVKNVDGRMLDPDAMIESLDRFTAELVSQASHLNKDDYKVSTEDNTWNEDTSPNEITFPSISGSVPNVVTFKSDEEDIDVMDGPNPNEQEQQSNDFSSVNTMTDSTIIAMEASKMVNVFKSEAEMSQSIASAASLELDHVQPPSQLNSLTSSAVGLEKSVPRSPKLISRKKSLPAGLLVKRALNNSLNHGSSAESLHSLTNLDHMNPPSELFDMDGSMVSVASLPSENAEVKPDFIINGVVNKDRQSNHHNPIFNIKQPHGFSQTISSNLISDAVSDLENVNPPSIFNEITDMCNSLADVPTEAIGSETEIFEDCFTHVADSTLLTDNDHTEFSDANSITPIPSDLGSSSAESTPKKTKSLSKSMTAKQKRILARERYKTYTVAAEMVMREEETISKADSTSEDFQTVDDFSQGYHTHESDTTYVSPTYTVSSSKTTPKDRRKSDKSRYETQVVDEAITSILQQPVIDTTKTNYDSDSSKSSSKAGSPARTKISIRRNFMQKRLENRDRFRTQTLSESSIPGEISSTSHSINGETDLHTLVQKEADLVLQTLRETKMNHDELLDCETLSLVSNDDDSEQHSGGSINYRTYHKSWGFRKDKNIPIIQSKLEQNDLVNYPSSNLTVDQHGGNNNDDDEEEKPAGKPKIVKPTGKQPEVVDEEQPKTIRGRRKPLYSKTNFANKSIKPIKNMTSNLVKNVTSTLKSSKAIISKQSKTVVTKPPVPQSRVSSGYGSRLGSSSPKINPPKAMPKYSVQKPNFLSSKHVTPPLERQGTFTKDEPVTPPASKIPGPTKIPSFSSKIAKPTTSTENINGKRVIKSTSADRANRNTKMYMRSTSADSRDTSMRKIQSSSSSQSLKTESGKMQNGAVKKSSIPSPAQRSNSNSSINSNGSAKKQVTSKIASLWKKIEESKNQVPKKDTRVWIQAEPEPPRLLRSNTFDNDNKDGVVKRNKTQNVDDAPKRVSRLGSFIVMDESEDAVRLQQAISAAANVG